MIHAPFKVVLDANVLYPFSLRDTLLREESEGFFQLYWSDQILEEARRSLVNSGRMTDERAARLRSIMEEAFPEAMVTGHDSLIAAMKNEAKDRHVVAAAVKSGAQVIVTNNLKHFRELPEDIEAQSADDFLCNLFDLDGDGMLALVKAQAAALKKPKRSFEDLLDGLEKLVPEFVATLRASAK